MPLLRSHRRPTARPLPEFRTISCAFNGHQVSWCRGLCTPIGSFGLCGRLAPHAMVGRTQAAIVAFTAREGCSGRP